MDIVSKDQLYLQIAIEMLKTYLIEYIKNPGRGSLDSFLASILDDVDKIAKKSVKVFGEQVPKYVVIPQTRPNKIPEKPADELPVIEPKPTKLGKPPPVAPTASHDMDDLLGGLNE